MASPIVSTMRTEAKLLVQDSSSTNAGLSDANWLVLFNIALRWFYDNTEKRVKAVTLVTGASVTPMAGVSSFNVNTGWPEILEASKGGTVLDRMGWSEIMYRQKVDSAVASTPTHWAAVRKGGASATWLLALYPLPDADMDIAGLVRDYPTALTADGDTIELGDHEARIVIILASILACQLLSRPDLSEKLVSLLPQMMQDKMASFVTHDELKTMERAAA